MINLIMNIAFTATIVLLGYVSYASWGDIYSILSMAGLCALVSIKITLDIISAKISVIVEIFLNILQIDEEELEKLVEAEAENKEQ